MIASELELVRRYANQSTVYVPMSEGEAIRIDYTDDDEGVFYGVGEETGEEYCVSYTEVDLAHTMWYQLTPTQLI
jgi:hypothetical protein